MKTADAYWLRQRWAMAQYYCREASETGIRSASPAPPTPPRDAQKAIGWLLLDLWDERLSDLWVAEHARDFVVVEDPTLHEAATDLEIYLRKLEGSL